MIPLIQGTWSSQNHADRKCDRDFQEPKGGENGKLLFSGHTVSVL